MRLGEGHVTGTASAWEPDQGHRLPSAPPRKQEDGAEQLLGEGQVSRCPQAAHAASEQSSSADSCGAELASSPLLPASGLCLPLFPPNR